MNELDWWIASQWEMFKIKEGKTGLEFNKTDKEGKRPHSRQNAEME